MERDLAHNVTLARGALLRLQDGQDLVITVQRGSVWVTQENDPDDTVLGSGERFTLDRPGLAIVEGLRAGAVCSVGPADDERQHRPRAEPPPAARPAAREAGRSAAPRLALAVAAAALASGVYMTAQAPPGLASAPLPVFSGAAGNGLLGSA